MSYSLMSALDKAALEKWTPRTRTGKLVLEGKITSLNEIFSKNLPLLEPEIVDYLLSNLKYAVVDRKHVQKMTDAGRRTKIQIIVIVGDESSYVGIGIGKARQYTDALAKALRDAKLNIRPIRRGCGSWECRCGEPHSVPFTVTGSSGSVRITLKPAPKGTGLVAGDIAKVALRLAGIRDVWTQSMGETRTTLNFAKAVVNALHNTYKFITPLDWIKA
ncbi:MAG: 30S ribosomal protein S5 [Desulfurococcaceae archaeon]|nr:30S ribosomal protein S5 [Desulfurococcaceae archaeon]